MNMRLAGRVDCLLVLDQWHGSGSKFVQRAQQVETALAIVGDVRIGSAQEPA